MGANREDLELLPHNVREAWRAIDYATPDVRGTCIAATAALETIFHDHMRLARENAELLHLPDRIRELRKAEAELAALRQKIAEAPTQVYGRDEWHEPLIGKPVALLQLPLDDGGEG